jgi:radical SAM protein with 4Fe4S-binding SPASM domain
LFTGGEPLLREDLFELLAEAKMLGLRTVLSTNGTLIDSKTASALAEAGVQYIGISVDGGRDFHDSFRQMKGCFDEAMAALENCKNVGLRTGLRFTITKANAAQIPHVFELAASMAVRRICFYHLISVGRAKNLRTQTPTLQQTRTAVDVIMDRTKDYVAKGLLDEVLTVANHADGPYLLLRLKAENHPSFAKAKELLLTAGGNKIGQNLACVSWDGSVFADQFWRNYSLGNVREKRFKQIWENADEPVLNKLRNKNKFADKRCLTCKWFPLCKGNFRFLGGDCEIENWLNEPACYLNDDEIKK